MTYTEPHINSNGSILLLRKVGRTKTYIFHQSIIILLRSFFYVFVSNALYKSRFAV